MSRRNREYIELLHKDFNELAYIDFVKDLLNLSNSDINENSYEINPTLKQYAEDVNFYKYFAKYNDGLNNIGAFIVKIKSTNERSKQRNFVASLLSKYDLDSALVAFYSDNESSWRISFVKKELSFTDKGIKQNLTPAKRYSYLVGKNESVHTAQEYLLKLLDIDDRKITINDIESVFDVEKVTKKFFEEYKEQFLRLQEYLSKNEDFKTESLKYDFDSVEFAKRLMGQIVFLYFLQKKGWLGVQLVPDELSNEEYNDIFNSRDSVSQNLLERFYTVENDKHKIIINEIRESNEDSIKDFTNIFINTKYNEMWGTGDKQFIRSMYKRAKVEHKNFFDDVLEPFFYDGLNHKRENQYFALLNCKIPFLNGGLFEPLNDYRWASAEFNIPDEYFSNDDETGILDFLDLYNFTIDEEEPLEKEIAVDPEMLGKIFENLLEVNDRKSKGAFYTPREIVYYMCQESLANYLVNKVGTNYDETIEFIKYGDLISQVDAENINDEDHYEIGKTIYNNLLQIDEALKNVKVADPAVGSGAFPLGILTEIVKVRNAITTYFNKRDNEVLTDSDVYNKFSNSDRSIYELKKETIENCIYAVDIELSAVDIAKLRLWLSLIVDYPNNEEPKPLPNLDCKIMQGNSLIDEYEGVPLFSEKIFRDSQKNNSSRFNVQQSIFGEVRDISIQQQLDLGDGPNINSFIEEMMKLQKEYFSVADSKTKKQLKNKIDMIQIGMICESLKDNPKKLASFKKIAEKRQKPWFIWKLEFYDVFKNNGGFDIVIGNPPYIKERENRIVFNPIKTTSLGRKWYQGKMDYWYFFLHIAINNINANGTISFITSRYWLNSSGATKLIKRINSELSFVYVIDIGKTKVFDNVAGYHIIAEYQKKKNDKFVYKKIIDNLKDINSNFSTKNVQIYEKSKRNVITSNNEIFFDENYKMYSNCIPLGKICNVSQGVVEAPDKISKNIMKKYPNDIIYLNEGVFVLSNQELEKLNLNSEEKKVIKKYLNGNKIHRYRIDQSDQFLIYSDCDVKKEIANGVFPNLKKHLDFNRKYITSSNGPYGIHRPRKKLFFESKKIVTPSMFVNPIFAIDYNNNYYLGMSYNIIVQNDTEYELEYIIAILNSSFGKNWFNVNGKHRGAGVDIGVGKLEEFPIKNASVTIKNELKNLVLSLEQNYNAENDKKIDKIVNELYNS
jgi:adenine-specific DNA-methyltransferase